MRSCAHVTVDARLREPTSLRSRSARFRSMALVMSPSPDATVRELQSSDCIVRIDLGPTLRLAEMIHVHDEIWRAMQMDPIRIVIDARALRSMTRAAHLALVAATIRLERAGVELVVDGCSPSARYAA